MPTVKTLLARLVAKGVVGTEPDGRRFLYTPLIERASYAGTDPNDVFAVFRRQSIGPRLFIDAILQDRSITPSFFDGHQVQRIVEAAMTSQRTGEAQAP